MTKPSSAARRRTCTPTGASGPIQGRGGVGKAIVHGLLERGNTEQVSQVRASVVPNTEASTLVPEVLRKVDSSAVVCTDASASYANLAARFVHHAIDHSIAYVAGAVHVNGVENFWSLLKRMIRGTYVKIAAFHLFRYVDEEAWRFNQRDMDDGERFAHVMRGVLGKRLTFRVLCAIDDAGFMGLT